MLKTLRITSLVAMILAACGVAVMVILGLRGDPDIKSILEKPSIIEKYNGKAGKTSNKTDDIHPLVNQAKLFALRINPPPPPPPPPPKVDKKATPPEGLARNVPPPAPRPQKVVAKFEVLATVRYEMNPEKSLTLLKSGNTIEWFRQGERAGDLNVDEVCDGSVIFSQSGQNKQTLFVPVKEGKSLLKNETTAVAANHQVPQMPQAIPAVSFGSPDPVQTVDQKIPVQHARGDINSRIQRVRAEPVPPTPLEQQESIESTMTGIQEVMNRQDETVSEEEREAENKMWQDLLSTLKNEKENLEAAKASQQPQQPQSEAATEASAQANNADQNSEKAKTQAEESAETETPPQQQPAEGEGSVSQEQSASADEQQPAAQSQQTSEDQAEPQTPEGAEEQALPEGEGEQTPVNEY